jgi:hypothetical protein
MKFRVTLLDGSSVDVEVQMSDGRPYSFECKIPDTDNVIELSSLDERDKRIILDAINDEYLYGNKEALNYI